MESIYPDQVFSIEEWFNSSESLVDVTTSILIDHLPSFFCPAEPHVTKNNGRDIYLPTVYDEKNGVALNLIPGGYFRYGLCRAHEDVIKSIAMDDEFNMIEPLVAKSRASINKLVKPFLMSRFPLFDTAAEEVLGELNIDIERPVYDEDGKGPFPIALTSSEAADFCNLTGYRLPSDFEWEYVAKEHKDNIFLGGNSIPDNKTLNSLCLISYGSAKKNQASYNSFGIAAMAVSNMISDDGVVKVRGGAAEFFPFQGPAQWAMLLTELRIPLQNMPGRVSAIRPCLDLPRFNSQ